MLTAAVVSLFLSLCAVTSTYTVTRYGVYALLLLSVLSALVSGVCWYSTDVVLSSTGVFACTPALFEWRAELILRDQDAGLVLLVTLVTFYMVLWCADYCGQHPRVTHFQLLLTCFGAFMVLLILCNDVLLLFLAWEGIGISSYLLIALNSTRVDAIRGGLKAVMMNRTGDAGYLVVLISALSIGGTTHLSLLDAAL